MSPGTQQGTDWLGRGTAGFVLGFVIALGLSGLFARFGPGEIGVPSGQAELTMWLVPPIWAPIFIGSFLFGSARRALLILTAVALLLWSPFIVTALRAPLS